MSEEFDMQGALSQMSEGLGFSDAGGDDNDRLGGDGLGTGDDGDSGATGAETASASVDKGNGQAAGDAGKTVEPGAGAAEEGKGAAEGTPSVGTSTAPRTWRAEAAAEWAKIPAVVQAEIAKREEDMFHGLEAYKQDAGFGKTIQKVLSPYAHILAEHKIDPITQINTLMNAHYQLAMGDMGAKVGMLQRIMQDYGITVDHLTGLAEVKQADPEVLALRQKISEVESGVRTMTEAQHREALAKSTAQVDAFAADPKNIHFDAVADDIVQLLHLGVCKTLEEAYEKAVWSNPVTRAAEQARLQTEQKEAAQKEAKAKADKARRATSANIKAGARDASRTAPLGTMDQTMADTLAAIHAREQ